MCLSIFLHTEIEVLSFLMVGVWPGVWFSILVIYIMMKDKVARFLVFRNLNFIVIFTFFLTKSSTIEPQTAEDNKQVLSRCSLQAIFFLPKLKNMFRNLMLDYFTNLSDRGICLTNIKVNKKAEHHLSNKRKLHWRNTF